MKPFWKLILLGDDTPRFETTAPLSAGKAL
jgi:hypothetical protein